MSIGIKPVPLLILDFERPLEGKGQAVTSSLPQSVCILLIMGICIMSRRAFLQRGMLKRDDY